MVSITASTLDTLLNLNSGVTNATLEEIIDTAIDLLNLYGRADLPNMGGTSGSKTVSLESNEAGAVKLVARAIYYGFYKGLENVTVSGLSVTTNDLLGNSEVMKSVKEAARLLSELEVDTG